MAELFIRNGRAVPLAEIPLLSKDGFRDWLLGSVRAGGRVAALFGDVERGQGGTWLYGAVAFDRTGTVGLARCTVRESFASMTPDCPEVHLFERELHEQFGILPEGHPWLKPVRFADPLRTPDRPQARKQIGLMDFFRVEGQEVHEVAVGPIHAGIIEPGHFRFMCHGERVFHLEISLGYQHRGVEAALVGGPDTRTIHYMETLAGDTTVGHATAYALAVEALAGQAAPLRAAVLRSLALELERLANHTGDLGALAGDVGYLPTMSFCGRLRGDFLNLTALICGNRFGRGLILPGGVRFDLEPARREEFRTRLEATCRDVAGAAGLLLETPSVLGRFEHTGTVEAGVAKRLGLVGPAARASHLDRDVRRDFPLPGVLAGLASPVEVAGWTTGDVYARALVRWQEIQESARIVRECLDLLGKVGEEPVAAPPARLAPDSLALALVEGWRGEICHACLTDSAGRIRRYKVVDPSFHNWAGLAMALRDGEVSDFPLCNKSFNLSYCGHDL